MKESQRVVLVFKAGVLGLLVLGSPGEIIGPSSHSGLAWAAVALPGAQPCSKQKLDEILAPATSSQPSVGVACSVTLPPGSVVTKNVYMTGASASGARFDCAGGTLKARLMIGPSLDPNVALRRPTDIHVTQCNVEGNVNIFSISNTDLYGMSREQDYKSRLRKLAPTRITLDRMKFHSTSSGTSVALYISPGVTRSTIQNSTFDGSVLNTAIYVDAEGNRNSIINNEFNVVSSQRELIAIDGAAHTTIKGNRFNTPVLGAIQLYRNCGERGVIRHQIVDGTVIEDNLFAASGKYYRAVWVSSRNNDRNYCRDDERDAIQFSATLDTSRTNNASPAKNTVIRANRFLTNPGSIAPVQVNDGPTTVDGNIFVTSESGRTAESFISAVSNPGGSVTSNSVVGFLPESPEKLAESATGATVRFDECRVETNNEGCTKEISCAPGEELVAVRAACNLEIGSVPQSQVSALPLNTVSVVRASDYVYEGSCIVGSTNLSSGSALVFLRKDQTSIQISCREHDKNGGDCHVMAAMSCRKR